jgi:hypothetical protein
MKKNSINNKDSWLNDFLKSPSLYLVILCIVLIYLFQDDSILNEPPFLFWIRVVLGFIITLIFCYTRFIKFKEYYKRKIGDKVYLVFIAIGITFVTILLQTVFAIPTSAMLKYYAKQKPMIFYSCPIKNIITTKIDKVHFIFLDKRYSRYFDIQNHERKDLIANYYLKIGVRKSILNTYYLESMELEKK